MKTGRAWFFTGLMALVMAGFVIVGCESTQSTDNVITINPESKTVNDWETFTFTASLTSSNSSLVLPLVWSVSDPSRGIIRASGGLTAIYEGRNVSGNNTITVRDQGDNSGIAVVINVGTPDGGDAATRASRL